MNNIRIRAAFTMGSFILLANPANTFAQTDADYLQERRYRNSRFDISIGFGGKTNLNTLQWTKFYAVDKQKRFHIGGGMRLFNLNYKGLKMEAEGKNETGFTRFPATGHMVGVNAMIAAEFLWNDKFGIGGSADLLGISIGSVSPSDGQNDFDYSKEGSPGITPGEIGGQISGLNARVPGKESGTFSSEIYGLYKFRKRMWVKLSYTMLATDLVLSHPQDRFEGYSGIASAGLRFEY